MFTYFLDFYQFAYLFCGFYKSFKFEIDDSRIAVKILCATGIISLASILVRLRHSRISPLVPSYDCTTLYKKNMIPS
jgi:hypothetical protein